MTKKFVVFLVLAGIAMVSTGGCRLDLFRRGALFRQPSAVVAPQVDPCAPTGIDPTHPAIVTPSGSPSVLPGPVSVYPSL
jgi:hypothetical protein